MTQRRIKVQMEEFHKERERYNKQNGTKDPNTHMQSHNKMKNKLCKRLVRKL